MKYFFYIALLAGLLIVPAATAYAQSNPAEISFWESVKDSKSAPELEAYLTAYPKGQFAPLARIRLNRLKAGGEARKKEGAAPASTSSSELGKQQAASGPPPVQECDRLAAHRYDPSKVTEGVDWAKLVADGAIRACRSALKKYPDETRFQFQLGRALQKAKAYAEALTLYRKAAEKGYVASFGSLGIAYLQGWGVPKDYTQALLWFRKGTEKGFLPAMVSLGYMYRNGLEVTKDNIEATSWYRKAAEKGNARAMLNLGYAYEAGRGVAKDENEAVKWYRKAAEKGFAPAMGSLGLAYATGRGVSKDSTEGAKWLRKAAEKGNAEAMRDLGYLFASGQGVAKDNTEAAKWYRKAAEKGLPHAMLNLGFAYGSGQGVVKDQTEAMIWYRKAAEKGNAVAMFNVGVNNDSGKGVARNPRVAARYLLDAYKAGGEKVRTKLRQQSSKLQADTRRAIQRLLNDAGVYSGSIDGKFGPGTRRAIEAFAARSGSSASITPPAQSVSDSLGDLKDLDKLD